jgi:hypothetical protein
MKFRWMHHERSLAMSVGSDDVPASGVSPLRGDTRIRAAADGKSSVATVAAAEPLTPVPTPFPAVLVVARVVSAQGLVSFRGNRYSVPSELYGATASVRVRLGSTHLDIATAPCLARPLVLPVVIARHARAPTGAGAMVRDHAHVLALERSAMAASTTERPHRGKERRPPSPAAVAAPRPCVPAPSPPAPNATTTWWWWSTSPATPPQPQHPHDANPNPTAQ